MHYKFSALYITLIVAVNYAFSLVPLAIGFVLILRDFVQREIGHKVLVAMLVGVVISYFMADPFISTASAAAFLVGVAAMAVSKLLGAFLVWWMIRRRERSFV